MQTTFSLDPDVERMLRAAVCERDVPFKEALNQAIRAGLCTGAKRRQRRLVQRTFASGSV